MSSTVRSTSGQIESAADLTCIFHIEELEGNTSCADYSNALPEPGNVTEPFHDDPLLRIADGREFPAIDHQSGNGGDLHYDTRFDLQ